MLYHKPLVFSKFKNKNGILYQQETSERTVQDLQLGNAIEVSQCMWNCKHTHYLGG